MNTEIFNSSPANTRIVNINFLNVTNTSVVDSETGVVSIWILVCYFIFIVVGMYFNLEIMIQLFKTKRNDVFSSILQLTAVDLISTYVIVTEIWTLNNGTWIFSMNLCSIYLSGEVLYGTFMLYFMICTNFHIISNMNLQLFHMQRDDKNPLTTYNNDNDDNDESERLVSKSENRNVVIDYRRKITSVSILLPSLLVWFICVSLSIPQYILSSAIRVRANCIFCTVLDIHYRQLLQNLLIIFRIIIPMPLLLLTLLILIWKLIQSQYSENVLVRKTKKNQVLLVFGLSLTVLCVITSVPRQLLHLMHVINQEFAGKDIKHFKMPPLENVVCSKLTNLIFAMFYYSSNTFRPLLYIVIIPEFRKTLHFSRMIMYFRKLSCEE